MRVSWLFPSLFVPLFFPLFCSSGWLKRNAFNFPWLKILLAIGLSYTGCIILWYNLFLLLQLPQGEQLGGLSDLPREVQSSHTHRHPQTQKGLLSSAENRVITYHALNSQNLSPVCIWPSLSPWLSLLSVSYPDTEAESPEALSFVFVPCFQVPRGDVTW